MSVPMDIVLNEKTVSQTSARFQGNTSFQFLCAEKLFALLKEIDAIEEQSSSRFPIFCKLTSESEWMYSSGGSWLGGYWAGIFWLKHFLSKNKPNLQAGKAHEKAKQYVRLLVDKLQLDSSHSAFIFGYGPLLGVTLGFDSESESLCKNARAALQYRYSERNQCFVLGKGLGAGEVGQHKINLDGLAPLIALLHRFGNVEVTQQLQNHVDAVIHYCSDEEGRFRGTAELNVFSQKNSASDCQKKSFVLEEVSPREQAWAMLGLTKAAEIWPEKYNKVATLCCEYWWKKWNDTIVIPQEKEFKKSLVDPSAFSIAALAMLRLSRMEKQSFVWEERFLRCFYVSLKSIFIQDTFVDTAALISAYEISPGKVEWVKTPWTLFYSMVLLSLGAGFLHVDDVLEMV